MTKPFLLAIAAAGFIALASGCSDDVHNTAWWQKQDTDKIESFLDKCDSRQNWNTECQIAYKALKLKQAGANKAPKDSPDADD